MKKASDKLEFEEAANLRDEIKRLELYELGARDASIDGMGDGEA
jgi:excinuclease UvrABC nuclease subunit